MNVKRILLLMLALVMILALAACTDDDEHDDDDDHDDDEAVNPCIEAGCHELGVDCHCHGACGVEGCLCHGGH